MKCLTFEETREWLDHFNIKIEEYRHLSFTKSQKKIMITLPRNPTRLYDFASSISDWFSQEKNLLVWISNWDTYPEDRSLLFEKIRLGCGEHRQLIESPGHLFPLESLNQEAIIARGIIFLILAFNWEAYLVQEDNSYVYLGDECVTFFNADERRLKAVDSLVQLFDVKSITDVREAWSR